MGSVSADATTESVEVLVNGVPVFSVYADAITRCDDRRLATTRKRKALGRSGSVLRQDYEGHQLNLTAADVRSKLLRTIDETTAGMALGTRPRIDVLRTLYWPQTVERAVQTFADVVITESSRTAQRGQDSEHSVTFETGEAPTTVFR